MKQRFSDPALQDPDASLSETLRVLRGPQRPGRRRMLCALVASAAVAPLRSIACSIIPSETEGPYPGDGTNGPNVLTQSGIVRSNIATNFGAAGTDAVPGTPLTITLTLVNTNDNCAPLAGYAIYAWHCDATGRYSLYSQGATGQNFLRGVQVTDAAGRVTFTTIYPGAYSGRWPHVHFEIYSSVAQAVSGRNAVKVSQLALPEATSRDVYAQASLYPASLANLNQTPLARDMVFADDGALVQMPSVTGSVAAGYVASLEVGIAAAATASGPDIDQQGLSGVWYEPESSGQGLALEVYPDLVGTGRGYLHGGWFTYDVAPAGGIEKQRWYTFSGIVQSGGSTAAIPLYANIGGNFNSGPATTSQQVGTATLSFSSCTSGTFSYTFSDGSNRSGSIPLTRLSPNVACTTGAAPAASPDFALSGNWYDPSTAGQGFVVEVNPAAPVVFFAWYTYAIDGATLSGAAGQRWFTGQAAYNPGARSISVTLYQTAGGIFDSDTPATQTTTPVGTATLTFAGCTAASLSYAFTAGSNVGRSGTIALSRIAAAPSTCTG